MTFPNGEPADNTKIKDLGSVLRTLFQKIQEGNSEFFPWQTNYQDRVTAGTSADPTAIDDDIILYGRDDSTSNKCELFVKNEDDNIVQLTDGVPIINNTALSAGETFLPGANVGGTVFALGLKWGSIQFSTTGPGSVDYTDEGLTDFNNLTLHAWVTPQESVAAQRSYYVDNLAATGFDVSSTDMGTNQTYSWLAIGY